MKVLLIVLLACVAVAFGNSVANLRKLEGRSIQGKTLPPAFFRAVDSLSQDPSDVMMGMKRNNFSQGCIDAINAVNANPICQVKNGTDPDPNIICVGACRQLWDGIHASCTGPGQEGQIGAVFGIYVDLICLTDNDGHYCFPVIKQLDQLGDDLTSQKLDIICSPCFYKLINVIFSHPEFSANASSSDVKNANAFIDLVCTRAEGKWCILTLQDDFCDASGGNTNCLIQDLNTLCKDRCFKKILAKLWLFADPNSQDAQNLETFLKFACVQDGPDYCLVKWTTSTAGFNTTCPDSVWNPQGCADPTCKSNAGSVVSTMGCCMETYLQFAENQGSLQDMANAIALRNRLRTSPCNFNLLAACPRQTGSPTEKKFYIRITWLWAISHDAEFRAAVRRDLAGFLGVPEEDVVIVDVGKDDDSLSDEDAGVGITFSAQGQNDNETGQMSSELDDAVASGTLTLPSVANAYSGNGFPEAAADPTPGGKSSDANVLSFMAALSVVMVALTL